MTNKSNNTTDLRQAKNVVTIEGLLLEIKSFAGTTVDGREYLSATLSIEVAENEQHNVDMFCMKLKADGGENGIYSSLETVVNEYKTVADVGREEADKVRVEEPTGTFNNGVIGINDYAGGDGQLRSFPQLSATFVNRVVAGDEYNPHAKFLVEVLVDNIIPEIKNEEESGRVILNSYISIYGGKAFPHQFVVNEDGSSFVEDNYEKGDTATFYGNITNVREVKEKFIESAFGEDQREVSTTYVREFEITGGLKALDEDDTDAFDPEAFRVALVQRDVYLEGLIEKAKNKEKNKGKSKGGTSAKQNSAFDTDKSKGKAVEIDDDSLPF